MIFCQCKCTLYVRLWNCKLPHSVKGILFIWCYFYDWFSMGVVELNLFSTYICWILCLIFIKTIRSLLRFSVTALLSILCHEVLFYLHEWWINNMQFRQYFTFLIVSIFCIEHEFSIDFFFGISVFRFYYWVSEKYI